MHVIENAFYVKKAKQPQCYAMSSSARSLALWLL